MPKHDLETIWIVVNTNSSSQANKIGSACLKARVCACYTILPIIKSVYYWPPKTGKTETSRGPLLLLHTLKSKYSLATKLVKSLHSDKLPLIGQCEIEDVSRAFYRWLAGELRPASRRQSVI